MGTISFRLDEQDYKLVQDYVSINQLNLSVFVREALLEKIEDSMNLNEEKILAAYKKSFKEPSIDHTEVWEKLGI